MGCSIQAVRRATSLCDDNIAEISGIGERAWTANGREYNFEETEYFGGIMESWKKVVIAGSVTAATVFFLKKKYPAGVLASGVALAVVAVEYPEKFEKVRKSMPEYFDRSMQVMEMAARAGKRITEAAGRSAVDAWEEIGG